METLLNLIKQNPTITQAQLMDKLSLTRRGVEWQIKSLKNKGLIIRVGATRGAGGYWKIIEK